MLPKKRTNELVNTRHGRAVIVGRHHDMTYSVRLVNNHRLMFVKASEVFDVKMGKECWEAKIHSAVGRGLEVKLRNRRIGVFPTDEGIVIRAKRLGGAKEQRIVVTKMALSDDAAIAVASMIDELMRKKLIK
jgi:hypothetical protein